MVFVKNWPFFHFILLGIVGQENIFYDILERKNSYLCYINKKIKKSKNWRFFEGVYSLEKLYLALKYQKNIFLGYKRHFLALQVLKMAILQTFFFKQYKPGKSLLRYSRTKKCLSRQ